MVSRGRQISPERSFGRCFSVWTILELARNSSGRGARTCKHIAARESTAAGRPFGK